MAVSMVASGLLQAFLHVPDGEETCVVKNSDAMYLISKHFPSILHLNEMRWTELQRGTHAQAVRCTYTAGAHYYGSDKVTITKTKAPYDKQVNVHELEQKTIKEQLTSAEQLLQLCEDAVA